MKGYLWSLDRSHVRNLPFYWQTGFSGVFKFVRTVLVGLGSCHKTPCAKATCKQLTAQNPGGWEAQDQGALADAVLREGPFSSMALPICVSYLFCKIQTQSLRRKRLPTGPTQHWSAWDGVLPRLQVQCSLGSSSWWLQKMGPCHSGGRMSWFGDFSH